ncbi:MAG TPA: DUF4292 domain-containing protein [Segetibacter sp.]|jgi:hypothetical protein
MKFVTYFLALCIVVIACRPATKLQKAVYSFPKSDTLPVVVAVDNKPVASEPAVKDVYKKLIAGKVNFNTFSAKIKVGLSSKEGKDEATAYIRIKKDTVIWISVRGPLGIEGLRVLVTADSVVLINALEKTVQFRTIDYLQDMTGMPLDFTALQDLIVGNPVFLDSNIISYKINDNKELEVLARNNLFRNISRFDNSNVRMLHSRLDDVNTIQSLSCEIDLSDYDNANGMLFSKKRSLSVIEKSKLDIDVEFKDYTFNQPVTFPFNIPKNYKRL